MPFTTPQEHIRLLTLGEGKRIADFGAGAGHHVFILAERVGLSGMVAAVDLQPLLVSAINSEAARRGLKTVAALVGDLEAPRGSTLADARFDGVLMANLLHQSARRGDIVAEARRILKPKGTLALVEWSDSFGGIGPHAEQVLSRQAAGNLLAAAGFAIAKITPLGSHHYGIIALK